MNSDPSFSKALVSRLYLYVPHLFQKTDVLLKYLLTDRMVAELPVTYSFIRFSRVPSFSVA